MRTYLPVKNDFVFKKLFGESGSEDILASLLEKILNIRIETIEIEMNLDLERTYFDQKLGVVDVKLLLDNQVRVNVEIQLQNEYNMHKRSFFYLSKLYSSTLKKRENYIKLKKTISINIVDFNLFEHEQCHSLFQLKDQWNDRSYYEEVMAIHFLELKKIINISEEDNVLRDWLSFITTEDDEVIEMLAKKNKDIKKAKEKLSELSADDEVRLIAESRAKYMSDLVTNLEGAKEEGLAIGLAEGKAEGIAKGKAEGIAKGKAEGKAEGIVEGRAQGLVEGAFLEKIKTIKSMLELGISDENISIAVRLPLDELQEIIEKEHLRSMK